MKLFSSCTILILILNLVLANIVLAASDVEENQTPSIVAIQTRPYFLRNEFSGHVSYFPLDQFNHYQALGAAYSHYFNDYMGWELVNFSFLQKKPTGLEDFIRGKGAVPEDFDVMNWNVITNLIYTPIYMKNLSFSKSILWGDISFVGGYGITNFETAKNVNTIDVGVLLRYFFDEKWAVKFDLRQHLYIKGNLKPNLGISLGLVFNFSEFEGKKTVEDDE